MAGYDAILPPMSSDPQARLWTQIRALQHRVASLERRRDVIYRGSGGGAPFGDETEFTINFSTSGRPLMFLFGPNSIYVGASGTPGEFPNSGYVYMDIATPTPHRLTTVFQNFSSVSMKGATSAISQVFDDIPPGNYTATVWSPNAFMHATWLILELPG